MNQFRLTYKFPGVPLVFYLKGKKQQVKKERAQEPAFLKEELLFVEESAGSHL